MGHACFMRLWPLLLVALWISVVARGSEAQLDVKDSSLKFTGHAFLHDFDGEAREFSGSAQVDVSKPELVVGARINIAAAKLTTFVDARDRNMFKWLQVDANPDVSFELSKVKLLKGDAASATEEHPAQFAVSGIFTLNKTAKPLEAQALGWRKGEFLVVTGKTNINTVDHGLPIVQQLFMTVDKEVDIDFYLVFKLPPDPPTAGKP
jgi:polyisoprenoid-binding protein YceI